MSTFQALNVDYENIAAEQEVDDTKELQIEDALKLYQAALKYHAEGPQSYEKAITAYEELFNLDIFNYPESQSEYVRSDTFPEFEEIWIDGFLTGLAAPTTTVESAPNTLPHIIYLSYKNHGRFLLDVMQWRVQETLKDAPGKTIPAEQIRNSAIAPLKAYSQALDKDDTDIELWRSSAAVAQLVGCNRIARFCLEAVLDMGEEALDEILGLPNVEQTLSTLKLQELSQNLDDDLSLLLSPLSSFKRQKLGEALKKRLESHTIIPKPSFRSTAYSEFGQLGRPPTRYTIVVPRRNWAAVGDMVLQQQTLLESGMVDTGPGMGIGISFPELTAEELDIESTLALPERSKSAPKKTAGPITGQVADEECAGGSEEKVVQDDVQIAGAENSEAPKNRNGAMNDTTEEKKAAEDGIDPNEAQRPPSRKRSQDSAELPEDDGRVRSKRIRKKETLEGASVDITKQNADWQLNIYRESDEWLFNAANVFLQKLGIPNLMAPLELRDVIQDGKAPAAASDARLLAITKDLYSLATSCTLEMHSVLSNGINGEDIDSFGAASREAGLNVFLGSSSLRNAQASAKPLLDPAEGIMRWTAMLNERYCYPKEVAWQFVLAFLKPGSFPGEGSGRSSSYIAHRWSDELKRCLVQIVVRFDEDIYTQVEQSIRAMDARELKMQSAGLNFKPTGDELDFVEMAQTLFELHLDVYSLIKRPGTNVDSATKTFQHDRLQRWSALANDAINVRMSGQEVASSDELSLRHIWATAFHMSVCDGITQAHVLSCMKDLKSLLLSLDEPCIRLQNNAVVSEISMAAIEQELSKINMKDFFARIFSNREEVPVETIETLEPILELSLQSGQVTDVLSPAANDDANGFDKTNAQESDPSEEPTPQEILSKFLASSTWTLRMSLWQRLRQAYQAIEYPTKVASCHLRSIEVLTNEMLSVSHGETAVEPRRLQLLRWFHLLDEFVREFLHLQSKNADIFESVDYDHLKSATQAVTYLLQMLHSFNLYEDQVRVGLLPPPSFEGRPKPSFTNTAKWIHNLQLRLWMLLYHLFQEAIEQDPEDYDGPQQARFEYLRTLHYAMGQRNICNAANKGLLHLLMDEFLKLSDLEHSDLELSQVVLDLYGLKFAPNPLDLMDHGCSEHELLSRKMGLKLLGFFMSQAQKVSMKDMPKSEMKSAIDKVQGALGRGRTGDDLLMNSRVFAKYMKTTINPLNLYAALRGTFELPTKTIPDSDAPVASKGWFSLLGNVALNKFKSVKRLTPGPCDDLNVAAAFFRQDIEYCSEHWESWYGLAQASDLQLEEHVAWSAEKLNVHSHEIFHYQRQAIHSYNMATACAMRNADTSAQTQAKVAEMYADFGMRVYASSRAPFSMLAFGFQEKEERHFSGDFLYQRPPFNPLQLFTAWRVASTLFKRSLAITPNAWATYYMLGKSLWKMYTHVLVEGSAEEKYKPKMQEVIDSFVNAVKRLPKRDNRKDPILEPHYKLIAILHKLVMRGDLSKEEASNIMQISSYAKKIPAWGAGEAHDSWTDYMQAVLKSLRSADKSGWHHRMTARAAHLVYDDSPTNPASAAEARHELTQQMFTKTMVLQVWKPEFERMGRHFVYTTSYVRFFVQLLGQLGDREGLSMLAKRLKRKADQYFEHTKLWTETCVAYLKLLRRAGSIPEGYEEAIFKSLNHEEFADRSAKLEIWCHDTARTGEKNTTYDVLCEVIEIKKTNAGLMKATLIDDLLGDTYAKLYEEIGLEKLANIRLPCSDIPPPKPMALTSVMNLDSTAEGKPPPEHQSKSGRSKGVGRRELQRKAEAAVNRPLANTTTAVPLRSTSISQGPALNQTVSVVIPSPRISFSSRTPTAGGDSQSKITAWASVKAPAAYEDSDDDSELSELPDEEVEDLEDEVKPKPLFPNLLRGMVAVEDTDGSATAGDGGDEEDEGEEGEDEQGDDEQGEEEEERDEVGEEEDGGEDAGEDEKDNDGDGDARMDG